MIKQAVIVITTFIASEAIWKLYNYRKGRKHKKFQNINKVIFFSEDSANCWTHVFDTARCMKTNCAVFNLNEIMNHIKSVKSSLDVCMYFLTYKELVDLIIDAHNRNVNVRVIIDASMAEHCNSKSLVFRRAGVQIKLEKSQALMHHKFVIIDEHLLLTGSTNWTKSALFGNFDNILITNNQKIVIPFVDEFNRLWKLLDQDASSYSNFKVGKKQYTRRHFET